MYPLIKYNFSADGSKSNSAFVVYFTQYKKQGKNIPKQATYTVLHSQSTKLSHLYSTGKTFMAKLNWAVHSLRVTAIGTCIKKYTILIISWHSLFECRYFFCTLFKLPHKVCDGGLLVLIHLKENIWEWGKTFMSSLNICPERGRPAGVTPPPLTTAFNSNSLLISGYFV